MSALSITVLIIVAIITLVFSVLHFILLFKGASEVIGNQLAIN